MRVLREDFYFEPRCISFGGYIKWYGEAYEHISLQEHLEQTVYIRDNGDELYIYDLIQDDCNKTNQDEIQIKAVFNLICKINKNNNEWIYGRRNK